MIEITETARERLSNYLNENKISSPIRLALMQGGCAGASLGLAIDETNEKDFVKTCEGLTLCMDTDLLKQCESVSVDFVDAGNQSGFTITSQKPLPGANAACGPGASSCGSGGCGC